MKIFDDMQQWRAWRQQQSVSRAQYEHGRQSIGFVPTMGNLHAGHESLLWRAVAENDIAVMSIYVNPTQFEDNNDLQNYPRTLDADLRLAQASGVDCVLLPDYSALYPDAYCYRVTESQLSQQLCGQFRAQHFAGVMTVVLKLLQLVRPTRAYFGEKDWQQLQLVKGMVEAFFIDTEIVACATVRDDDGVALSSRNSRLTGEQRVLAARFAELLQSELPAAAVAQQLRALGFVVDYIEDRSGRRFGAVRIGQVRLIDNCAYPSPFGAT
jgi:pantoate--beta-alanine ligase